MALNKRKIAAFIILGLIIIYANYKFIKSVTPDYSVYSDFFTTFFKSLITVIIAGFVLIGTYLREIKGYKRRKNKQRDKINKKNIGNIIGLILIIGISLWYILPNLLTVGKSILDMPRAINRNPIVDNERIKSSYKWTKVILRKYGRREIPMVTVITDKNTFSYELDDDWSFGDGKMVTIYYLPHTKTVLSISNIKSEWW